MYYVLANSAGERDRLIDTLQAEGIGAVFHYVPLHSSHAGRAVGRAHGDLTHTDDLSARLIRLPMWVGLEEDQVARVCDRLAAALG